MEQRPSWETNRSSASQEISRILWNPKVYYRIHKSPPPVRPEPHRSSPCPRSNLSKINFNIILTSTLLGRTEASVRFRCFFECVVTWLIFYGEELLATHTTPKRWRTTPYQLSVTAYSVCHSCPPYLQPFLHPPTWGRAMPWWQVPLITSQRRNPFRLI